MAAVRNDILESRFDHGGDLDDASTPGISDPGGPGLEVATGITGGAVIPESTEIFFLGPDFCRGQVTTFEFGKFCFAPFGDVLLAQKPKLSGPGQGNVVHLAYLTPKRPIGAFRSRGYDLPAFGT